MDYTVHGILQVKILEWVAFPFSRGSSQPGIEPRSPALQVDSLPSEPPGESIEELGQLLNLSESFVTCHMEHATYIPHRDMRGKKKDPYKMPDTRDQ